MNLKHYTDDQEFLSNYLAAYNFIHGTNPNDISYIKDSNLNYCSCTPNFTKLLDSETDQIIGANNYQLNYFKPFPQLVESIWQQESQICQERSARKFLYITPAQSAYIVHKSAIINPMTKNMIGIHGHLSKFVLPHPIVTICQIKGKNIKEETVELRQIKEYERIHQQLSERRQMILFFCLHRYSASEIAEILTTLGYSISTQRVNEHITKLKYIFMVKSKDALIDKAASLNFQRTFPRKLLKIDSYPLDNNEMLIVDR